MTYDTFTFLFVTFGICFGICVSLEQFVKPERVAERRNKLLVKKGAPPLVGEALKTDIEKIRSKAKIFLILFIVCTIVLIALKLSIYA